MKLPPDLCCPHLTSSTQGISNSPQLRSYGFIIAIVSILRSEYTPISGGGMSHLPRHRRRRPGLSSLWTTLNNEAGTPTEYPCRQTERWSWDGSGLGALNPADKFKVLRQVQVETERGKFNDL